MGTLAQAVSHSPSHLNATADRHKIHVIAGAHQKDVPNVSTHDVALAAHFVGNFTYQFHDRQINMFGNFMSVDFHDFCFLGCKITSFFGHVEKNV